MSRCRAGSRERPLISGIGLHHGRTRPFFLWQPRTGHPHDGYFPRHLLRLLPGARRGWIRSPRSATSEGETAARGTSRTRPGRRALSLCRELDHLLEGGPVDPGDGGHGPHTDGAELDVVELGVALAAVVLRRSRVRTAGVVGARAGPAGGIAAPVDAGELVDGGLERALQGRPARSQVPSPAVGAAAVDLGVPVRDARVQRLPQRTLQVAFPAAVVA